MSTPQKVILKIHQRIQLLGRRISCHIRGEPCESRGTCADFLLFIGVYAYPLSLLLHAILSNETYAPERGVERLTLEDFDKIGTLSFTQLAELRHRGAFSAVSQTFATCCQCCGKSKESAVFNLPAAWYQVRNSFLHSTYIAF